MQEIKIQNKQKNKGGNRNLNNSTENPFFIKECVSECWKISLSERVKFLLSIKGKTQNWLADEIGINKGTLSKIINCSWSPTFKIKLVMAEKLEVDSLVLFGDAQYFKDYQKTIQKININEVKNE